MAVLEHRRLDALEPSLSCSVAHSLFDVGLKLLGVWQDELDVEHVRLYELRRRG